MFITDSPWKDHYLRVFHAPDGDNGTGSSGTPEGGEEAGAPAPDGTTPDNQPTDENDGGDIAAQLARLKADMAKQKAALDKATSEANGYKKQLRARQSAEEIAAEEAKAAEEARNAELQTLRKQFAVMETRKNIAVKLGGSDDASEKIAEYLYGAEDADAVITEFQKILAAQEKKLRLEYGRVPPPGSGSGNGEDEATMKALEFAKQYGQSRAESNKTVREGLGNYVR